MNVTITGATGLIGGAIIKRLTARGDAVTVLSRRPDEAAATLGVAAERWDPLDEPAPASALAGRDAVVHLAGEQINQRWNDDVKRRIRDSRVIGTRNLVAGLLASEPRPAALASASAVGYYGFRGAERLDEQAAPGTDFLAQICLEWEREAQSAADGGVRVANVRTGIVLAPDGGALKTMLTPFRLGVGGPVAGGRQYMPWVHIDDVAGIYVKALDDAAYSGPFNATAPEPVTNREFSKALGRALHRPAIAPVPKLALRILYGEMGDVVAEGQRAVPAKALELGYRFEHPDLDEALRAALA